jgi:hypothetical protein
MVACSSFGIEIPILVRTDRVECEISMKLRSLFGKGVGMGAAQAYGLKPSKRPE